MIERYTLPAMARLWSDETRFSSWLKVEQAVAEAQGELGIIPREAADAIRRRAAFDIARIAELEADLGHDVVAFLTSVSENIGSAGKYLHYGLTSSDILDTSISLLLTEAADLIAQELEALLGEVKKKAFAHEKTPILGRTHGVAAEPMSLGHKFALWYAELVRGRQRLAKARQGVAVGKISGAVGNYANVTPRVEERVCRRLKLQPAPASSQIIQRDRHAEFVTTIALIGASLEKMATEVRNLSRTEIGEMAEPFGKKQKGSSAMPHKKNPVICERVCGMARLLRGYALTAMENICLWHERDISHSSAERVLFADSTTILHYMLVKFTGVVKGLVVNPERMLENIYARGGTVFSQSVLLVLAERLGSREQAYKIAQRNAFRAAEGEGDFKELLNSDAEVRAVMSPEEIERCFSLDRYLDSTDTIFGRVFGETTVDG